MSLKEFFENKVFRPIKLETFEGTIQNLSAFKNTFHPKADVVYYPGSGPDISIAKVFPESRIIFVDSNATVVNSLKENSFEAYAEGFERFSPDAPVDILVLINPMRNIPDKPFETLREGGFLVCNDKHHTAKYAKHRSDMFILRAALKGESVITDNLESCLKDVATDEDLKEYKISYKEIADTVKLLTGKTENIVEEYKKILESPDVEEMLDMRGIKTHDGKWINLESLPTKHLGDMYVFEKILKTPAGE